jgi:type II secretory ATPase GspE/PulE/Tfp pilus assembly ATPase PilB-like protein/ActR/RegA family two-component response regulator
MLENLLTSVDADITSVDADITDIVDVVDGAGPETLAAEQVESGPVVKLTNLILSDAAKKGASDIHMEPGRAGGTVRFRVDGVLRTYMQMPMPALNRAVSRIKILGDLDIADRLRPQDGRARILVGERVCDLRISTVPTRHAEKLVVRILDPEGSPKLSELGLAEAEHERFRHMLSHREGIVVITGPTGSGKTTTLYAALQELATEEVNIMTVEDPVEYELAGITQIQVEPRQKVTFASALRAILRQDPDVILIGEIRDLETAAIAVQASLTGHLVLATLHTNEAIGVVGRLKDLGLETASIGESMRGLVAQRLLRTVCPNCSERIGTGELTPEEQRLADSYGVKPVVRPGRCDECGKGGYRGRVAAMEAVTVTSELSDLIAAGASAAELRSAATAGGMRPLREVALGLVTDGVTTLQEVERALGERAEQPTAPSSDKPHVLLVDDDSIVRLKSRAVLEKNGFDVSEANDGAAGLETIQSGTHFDLVVLDLDMPRMGGLEVLQQVRRSVATAGLPVIVLTGSEEVDSEVKLMEEGADDYIRKPIDPPKFVARVKATLRRAGG